jgi:hypothetical protein
MSKCQLKLCNTITIRSCVHLMGCMIRGLIPGRCKIFFFSEKSRMTLRHTQVHIHWIPRDFVRTVKRPGHRIYRWHLSSVEDKNKCTFTSTPFYDFMSCSGVTLPLLLLGRHLTSQRCFTAKRLIYIYIYIYIFILIFISILWPGIAQSV